MPLGCLVEVVGVTASVAIGGTAGPLLGGVLLGGTFIAITALGLQTARQLAPQAPRRIFALMTASFGIGQIVGPIVAGLLAQASGNFFLASIVAAAVLLVVSGASPGRLRQNRHDCGLARCRASGTGICFPPNV